MKKIIILCIAITLFAVLNAQTLVVRPGNPDCYQTIQEAVADCPDGGTVLVYPGEYEADPYNNCISWSNKNITLKGISRNNRPIINGQIDLTDINNLSKISNFIIRAHNVPGILLRSSNPVISGIRFELTHSGVNKSGINYSTDTINGVENIVFEILDCQFIGSRGIRINNLGPNGHVIVKSCDFINNYNDHSSQANNYQGSAISVLAANLTIEDSFFLSDLDQYHKSQYLVSFYSDYSYLPILHIRNNSFKIINTTRNNYRSFIKANIRSRPPTSEIIIDRNTFYIQDYINNIYYDLIYIYNTYPSNITYTNNTSFNEGISSVWNSFYVTSPQNDNNVVIKNSIFDGTITGDNFNISNSWFIEPDNAFPADAVTRDIHYGDPQIDPVTLAPIWTANTKSGLIDAGNIDTNGNGVIWYEDSEDQDIDGTRIDIGAVPATDHGQFKHTLESSGYNWVCFPYLDKLHINLYDIMDQMYYMLHNYNDNHLFVIDPLRILENIEWNYNQYQGQVNYDNQAYTNTDLILDSRYGFKVKLYENVNNKDIVTGGFLCGTENNPEDEITIMAKEPGTQYREIWVGYFKEKSEEPNYALQDIINNPNLIEIKTKYWAMYRTALGWIGNAIMGHPVAFNQGEAVSLKYTGDTDISFRWKTRDDIITPKYVEPETKYFTYEEQADYIPVYVELSEDMVSDEKAELALFIDDVCYGAEVVKGDTIQINAYLEGAPIDTGIVEFRYYNYESKAPTRVINDYLVFHQSAQVFQARDLDFTQNELFYSVSFNKDEVQTETTPAISCLEGNYPNPFNPTTTIKYNIAQKEHIKLQIFNVKGQMINELINDEIEAGFHKVVWNGDDHLGNQVASGVYFYKLETSSHSEMRKMLLMK